MKCPKGMKNSNQDLRKKAIKIIDITVLIAPSGLLLARSETYKRKFQIKPLIKITPKPKALKSTPR